MMKRILLLSCLALLAVAGRMQAQCVTVDGIEYAVDTENGTASVTSAEISITAAHISATVEYEGMDYPVTAIGNYAFAWHYTLKSITLPEGVETIGEMAFYDCTSLQSVTLPEGLQSIGESAFYYCYALQSVTFPEGLQSIGSGAFSCCESLAGVTLPSTLQSIGEMAFSQCPLTDIACHAMTPPAVRENTFDAEVYATASLAVPESAEQAYQEAETWRNFFNRTTIEGITYTVNKETGTAAAIYADPGITEANILATVAADGREYPVTAIGMEAFNHCASLKSVTIPDGVASIGGAAFFSCLLEQVVCQASVPPMLGESVFGGLTYALAELQVPSGAEQAYRVAEGWCYFYLYTAIDGIVYGYDSGMQGISVMGYMGEPVDAVIPATVELDGMNVSVTGVAGYAFSGCTSLRSITLPETVTNIGNWAFHRCTSLESITLPEGIQSIGNMVFAYCASLAGIVLPSTMQYIDATAFADCPLKEVYSHAAVPPTVSNGLFDEEIYAVATLHVPSNAVEAYQAAEGWKQFQRIIGDLPSTAISSVATDKSLATYASGVITTESPATITVHAQNGAVVRHAADATSLSLEGLSRGIYIISIAQDGQRQVMKVIH